MSSESLRWVGSSVADPDSFFTDPDPGIFFQSGSGSRQKKLLFSKAITKFWEKYYFSTQKVDIFFNQSRRYLFYETGNFYFVSSLKISENYEKFVQ